MTNHPTLMIQWFFFVRISFFSAIRSPLSLNQFPFAFDCGRTECLYPHLFSSLQSLLQLYSSSAVHICRHCLKTIFPASSMGSDSAVIYVSASNRFPFYYSLLHSHNARVRTNWFLNESPKTFLRPSWVSWLLPMPFGWEIGFPVDVSTG